MTKRVIQIIAVVLGLFFTEWSMDREMPEPPREVNSTIVP